MEDVIEKIKEIRGVIKSLRDEVEEPSVAMYLSRADTYLHFILWTYGEEDELFPELEYSRD